MMSLKTPEEIATIRKGAGMLAVIMQELQTKVVPGITTSELDDIAHKRMREFGTVSAFKGQGGFPGNICASVNDEVVHGVPGPRKLKEGDIVTLDIGLMWEGFHTDMARTFPVGEVDPSVARLLRITKKALKLGIKKAKPGNTVGDIGNTIQRFVEQQKYGLIRGLCGHGIGKELHEDPQVPNYGSRNKGAKLKTGMVLCIEPMLTLGTWEVKMADDGQAFVTEDGSISAHFEDMVAIGPEGPEVLTQPGNVI